MSAACYHSVVVYYDPATTSAYEKDLINSERDVWTCEVGREVHVPEPAGPYEGQKWRSFRSAFCHYSYQVDETHTAVYQAKVVTTNDLYEDTFTIEMPKEGPIRLLSLNLFLRPPLISNPSGDYKEARRIQFCRSILPSYDIVCLQEVFGLMSSRKAKIIAAAKALGYAYSVESPNPGFFGSHLIDGGLLILSRYPILEWEFRPFEFAIFPDTLADKGVLYCKLDIEGVPLQLVTAHTQSAYETSDMDLYRLYRSVTLRQIGKIAEFIREKRSKTGLIVLVGDLNVNALAGKKPQSDPAMDEYAAMMSVLQDLHPSDVLYEACGFHPATHGRLSNGEPEETVLTEAAAQGKEEALDYLFTFNESEGELGVDRTHTRVDPLFVQGHPFTQISDHAAILTVLKLKQ